MCFFQLQGCLGALDGTHVNVLVSNSDKPRYRTRKGSIATNTLAVCDRNMQFVYILPGWEGSAGDSRVLRDALSRTNGFRVPQGRKTLTKYNNFFNCATSYNIECSNWACYSCAQVVTIYATAHTLIATAS